MSFINVMEEDEFKLHGSDSDSSFRESLAKTGGTIGENFATLSQQEVYLVSRIEMIKRQIEEYKKREPKLAEYAKKILAEKQKIDNEKQKYSEELESEQTRLESEITRLAEEIHQLNERSQTVSAENDELSRTKNAFSLKIEDMSALETDFANETVEIDARIEFFNKEMEKSTRMMPDSSEMQSLRNSIIDMDKRQTEVRANCDEFADKDVIVRSELQSIQMEERKLATERDTNVHVAKLEIDRLKRKLARAMDELESEYQMIEKRKLLKEQLIDAIDTDEVNIESADSSTTHAKSAMIACADEIATKETEIKHTQHELTDLGVTLEFIKDCKNIDEYNKKCAIRETKAEKIAVMRKSGELMLQCKMMKKSAKERRHMIYKLSQKLEMAAHIEKLLEKGEKAAKKNEITEDPSEIDALVAQLNMLNQHIAAASKYGEVLDNHKFHDLTPSLVTVPNETNQQLKERLRKARRINASLKSKIEEYSRPSPEPVTLLHNCPLFPHTVEAKPLHTWTPTNETKSLEDKIHETKARIQRKRESLIARKIRLDSVSDNPPTHPLHIDAECSRLCNNCSRVGIVPRELTYAHAEKLLQRLKSEADVWRYSRFLPTTLLDTWNNQIEHLLRDCYV